jgi:hypothetical protein
MSVHGHFYLATVIWVSPSLLLLIRESQVKRMREAESVIVWIVRRGYPLCHDMFVIAKVVKNIFLTRHGTCNINSTRKLES